MDLRDRLVFALDVPDGAQALRFVDLLRDVVGTFKVGLELFCAEGPALVMAVAERSGPVFLDLKLHDIPATVGRAVGRVAAWGCVKWLTVHSAGGAEMLQEAVRAGEGRTRILGVTVLTSVDDAAAAHAGLGGPVVDVVLRLARLAVSAGCAGVVASPREAAAVRATLGAGPLIVTPGIRPAALEVTTAIDDQRRVSTPGAAVVAGADVLVVGRPIRDARDPAAVARGILAEVERAQGEGR